MKGTAHLIFVAFLTVSVLVSTGALTYAADLTGKMISEVSVNGNESTPESRIMAVITVKPGDTFNPDRIRQDMQAIYNLGSFLDVTVNFAESPQGVKVIYSVTEKTNLKDIVFKGNTKVSTDKLQSLVSVSKGADADNTMLNKSVQAIEQYYHDQGYILAKVNLSLDPNGILTISINEGVIEGIIVKGNEKTQPQVITREIKLKPGDPFNAKDAKRSMQKVYNLGYFEDVNMRLNPGLGPNSVVLEVDVKEKRTGTFSIGGGYSQQDGLVGLIGIGDTDFDGSGDQVSLDFQLGGNITGVNWSLKVTRPWLDDKQTSLTFDIFNSVNEWDDYGLNGDNTTLRSTYYRRSRGFDVTLGRPQGEYVSNYITFTDRKDIYQSYISGPVNYLETDTTASDYNALYNAQYLADNFGTVHSVTLSRVYDSRDNVFNPSEGRRVSLMGEFAGNALGGQFNYDKYTFDWRQYFKVGGQQVVALRLISGYAVGDVPDASKYVLGGIDSLRGYSDEEFKGDKMFTSTAEYRYPITKKIGGVIFADIGNAWDGGGYQLNDLKYDFGTGLRIDTPLGPIRLDFAHGDEGFKCQFSFGTQF